MGVSSFLEKALDLRKGEERQTLLMIAHAFFMGISTVFFETAASALFLSRFNADLIPWVYIGASIVNTAAGLIYSRLRSRVSFPNLMIGTIVFLMIAAFAFRIGLWMTAAGGLVFALFLWYRVLSILTDLEYWAVATRLYDVRQAKRLFGLIGSGEVVARIAGSFAVPMLLLFIGVGDLIMISAVGLAACLIILLAIIRGFPSVMLGTKGEEEVAAAEVPDGLWQRFRQLLQNRYLVLLFSLSALAVLGKYFVDFAFLQQMQTRFEDVGKLAGFFGIFSGVTQLVNLAMRVFLSGRLLNRFGIKLGLTALPVLHTLCTVAVLVAGLGYDSNIALFWLVVMNQGIYKTIKHPIDNPSFKVLYQPLRADQRFAAQLTGEVIVTPLAFGFAGVVMLLFSSAVLHHPVHFAWLMLVVFIGWVAVATLTHREYSVALVQALRRRVVDDHSFSLTSDETLKIVQERLSSDYPGDVIFSLDLLERIEHPSFPATLDGLITHPSEQVRQYAVETAERAGAVEVLPTVRRALDEDSSPKVRAAAIRTLAVLGEDETVALLTPFLESSDRKLRTAALVGLLKRAGTGIDSPSAEYLRTLTSAADPSERAFAAYVIGEVGTEVAGRLLSGLLVDRDAGVRRSALVALARTRNVALAPLAIESLSLASVRNVALPALVAMGPAILPLLRDAFRDDAGAAALIRMARIVARIGGEDAVAFLRNRIDYPIESIRQEILIALNDCKFVAGRVETVMVKELIFDEARDAFWKLKVLRDLGEDPLLATVRNALRDELESTRRRIFLLLSFIFDRKSILRARDNHAHSSSEKRAYSLEVIDVVVTDEIKRLVMPLLDEITIEEKISRYASAFPDERGSRVERLAEVLQRPAAWLHPWTRAAALHAIGRLRIGELDRAVDELTGSRALPFVSETALWAAGELRSADGGGRTRAMLTVEKVIILKTVSIFSNTAEEILAELASVLETIELKSGESIFQKGDVGTSMYVISDGRVRVHDGAVTYAQLGARDIFGELAMLDPEPRSATVTAIQDTTLFKLDREAFFEVASDHVEVFRGVFKVLCQRLRRATAAFEKDNSPAPESIPRAAAS